MLKVITQTDKSKGWTNEARDLFPQTKDDSQGQIETSQAKILALLISSL